MKVSAWELIIKELDKVSSVSELTLKELFQESDTGLNVRLILEEAAKALGFTEPSETELFRTKIVGSQLLILSFSPGLNITLNPNMWYKPNSYVKDYQVKLLKLEDSKTSCLKVTTDKLHNRLGTVTVEVAYEIQTYRVLVNQDCTDSPYEDLVKLNRNVISQRLLQKLKNKLGLNIVSQPGIDIDGACLVIREWVKKTA